MTGALRPPGSGRLLGSGLPRRGQEVGEVGEFGQKAGSGVLPVGDDRRRVRLHALTGDIAGTGTVTCEVTGGQVSGAFGAVTDRTAVRLTGPASEPMPWLGSGCRVGRFARRCVRLGGGRGWWRSGGCGWRSAAAPEGRAVPVGGHSDVRAHVGGDSTDSIFTSWTHDIETATDAAQNLNERWIGEGGIMLRTREAE